MTRSLITVTDGETVEQAMHVMTENDVSSVVVEPNAAGDWGILTRRDIVTKIVRGSHNPATTRVADVATRPVESVSAETSIREAARIIADRNFSRLPVSQGDKIIGIVTEQDIFATVDKFGWAVDAN
ncbi:CBS domain-containing protein [Flagellatimonas centrodinii]|nr:CBS domain-containing protein [Flagellatimonas centrodinii]ULQ48289.1 CBS domain-containing protein [Flagellatimonas centrodinii]